MLYKQGVMHEEKTRLFICIAFNIILYLTFITIACVKGEGSFENIAIFSLLLLPMVLLLDLAELNQMEWFCFYSDRVEVKTIYGVKNIAYYKDITSIEKTEIFVARGCKKPFYIFHVATKEKDRLFVTSGYDLISCYNKKKTHVRVYYTEELERFIQNTLTEINIVVSKNN